MVGVTMTNLGALPLRVFCLRPWSFNGTVDPSVEAPLIHSGLLCLPDAVAINEMLTDDTHTRTLQTWRILIMGVHISVMSSHTEDPTRRTHADHHHWCKNIVLCLEKGTLNRQNEERSSTMTHLPFALFSSTSGIIPDTPVQFVKRICPSVVVLVIHVWIL